MKQHEIDEAIESLFDKYSASEVFNSAARVCSEKAEWVAGGGSHGEPSAYLAACWRKVEKAAIRAASLAAEL